jgi:hypothetical protein
MPVVSRIPPEHPQRAEILRLLAGLDIPEGVSLTISQSTYPALGWELMVVSQASVSVRCVPMNEGPGGVLSVAAKMVAGARAQA